MSKPTAFILLALSVGLFYTFTSPQYDAAKELRARAAEYRSVLDNVNRIVTTRDSLLLSYEEIPEMHRERLSKVLPEDLDTVNFARDLDAIASQYGVAVTDISVETEDKESAALLNLPEFDGLYQKASVSFSFISNYPNFSDFLADLEKSLRLMDVQSASFRVTDAGLYEHKLSVNTYWLK